MILWTPMQMELVLEGIENMTSPSYCQISYRGVSMLVEKTDGGRKRIARLLSTNPADYLNTDYTPGKYLDD